MLADDGPELGGSSARRGRGRVRARPGPRAGGHSSSRCLAPAAALGFFDGHRPDLAAATRRTRSAPSATSSATGSIEQPLSSPATTCRGDAPGGARRLVDGYTIKPGERAVVATVDDRGLEAAADLEAAGVELAKIVDFRNESPSIEAQGRGGKVAQVSIGGYHVKADLLVMSGSPQPNYKLLAQAGARVAYDESRGVFVPTDLPANVEAVGAVTGDVGAPRCTEPILDHRGDKCFVCFCEDQTTKDLKYAIAEGFDSIELSKRYTTVTMGPCQGRLCHTNSIRVYAKTTGLDENTIGTTTSRPPYTPISMGLLAGPPQEPRKRTSLHHRHKDMGGTMMWTGAWRRPHSYGPDAGAEAQHVHTALGLIDVSTPGKILVTGPRRAPSSIASTRTASRI